MGHCRRLLVAVRAHSGERATRQTLSVRGPWHGAMASTSLRHPRCPREARHDSRGASPGVSAKVAAMRHRPIRVPLFHALFHPEWSVQQWRGRPSCSTRPLALADGARVRWTPRSSATHATRTPLSLANHRLRCSHCGCSRRNTGRAGSSDMLLLSVSRNFLRVTPAERR